MKTDDWSRNLTTRTGLTFHVRPARPDDEAALAEFFTHVTPEDLRFRFLGGMREVSHDHLVAMTQVDHHRTENFLAFAKDGKSIITTAMLACDDALEKARWRSPSTPNTNIARTIPVGPGVSLSAKPSAEATT